MAQRTMQRTLSAAIVLALCTIAQPGGLWSWAGEGGSAVAVSGAEAKPSANSPAPASESLLPDGWRAAWKDPPAADRPLQIVHGIRLDGRWPRGIAGMGVVDLGGRAVAGKSRDEIALAVMAALRDHGLGGIVCNVAFDQYLRSEEHWQTLQAGVEACRRLGLVVWIYDEEGYPSGAAGGLVLANHPEYEAQALAYDPTLPDPFVLRPAYEHTHASNNYHAARRYINLLDDRAVAEFIRLTHEAYRQRLGAYFGSTIQATFTDEPSLIAINLGQLLEAVRRNVRVVDPLDPKVRPLPSVPWGYDLAQQYRRRYGQDLLAVRKSLFVGDSAEDRRVRRQFWSLVADLVADRYFGALQRWCRKHGLASSGHTLWEEAVMHHPALEGNALKVLGLMDIPGLDMLTSDPAAVMHSGWLTAGLPSSAALLHGRRRVMTEVSDFSQKMGAAGPASLDAMRATAAWQAAWGVTDFTLYYALEDRPAEAAKAYGLFVGRLNAVLKPAQWQPEVLLYYPIYDLWAEYRPVAEPLSLASQSPRAQRLVQSFNRLGQLLQRHQVPLAIVDHEALARASAEPGGRLKLAGRQFRAVLLPDGAEVPDPAGATLADFHKRGGTVLRDGAGKDALSANELLKAIQPRFRLDPPQEAIALGQFSRDGRTVLLVVNVGRTAYQGSLTGAVAGTWITLDPAAGSIARAEAHPSTGLPLKLAPAAALLLVTDNGGHEPGASAPGVPRM